jgi:phosphate transport system substrate-binding protein
MRKAITGLLVAAMLVLGACGKQDEGEGLKGTITISGAWALYPMAVKWAEEFQKAHPGVRFDISAGGAGKGMADVLSGAVDIGLVSREVNPAEIAKGAFPVAVTKDAVVAVANKGNPMIGALRERGITKQAFVGIWITQATTDWSELFPGAAGASEAGTTTINVYTRSDACGAAETWAAYLGAHQEDLEGVGVYGDPGVAEAVSRDPLGIGYNNVNFAYDAHTRKPVAGLVVIPIDLNENGVLDDAERFYATRDEIVRAIGEGAYPSPPARPLYFVTRGTPERRAVSEFIRWVLTEGQKEVAGAGYVALSAQTLEQERRKLSGQ